MLWYKAWLETRGRFLACLTTLTLFCFIFVHHAQEVAFRGDGLVRPGGPADYYRLLFVNQQFLVIMWVVSAVLLGMGGLVREKAVGVSTFTLSLPVSRSRLFGVRVAMGILQSAAIAILPWCAVFLASSLGGTADSSVSGVVVHLPDSRRRSLLLCDGDPRFFLLRRGIHRACDRLWRGSPDRHRLRRVASPLQPLASDRRRPIHRSPDLSLVASVPVARRLG